MWRKASRPPAPGGNPRPGGKAHASRGSPATNTPPEHRTEHLRSRDPERPGTQTPVGTRTSRATKCNAETAASTCAIGARQCFKRNIRHRSCPAHPSKVSARPCLESEAERHMEDNSRVGGRHRGRCACSIRRCKRAPYGDLGPSPGSGDSGIS